MSIVLPLKRVLEQLSNNQLTTAEKIRIMNLIDSAAINLSTNPRIETQGNLEILNAAIVVIIGAVQDLYGDGDMDFAGLPEFMNQANSQVAPLKMTKCKRVGIGLGTSVKTWEDVFYDICHESVHVLNPVFNVRDCMVKVSSLDEGVAVKFAEQMFEKYYKPYSEIKPTNSPVNAVHSQYYIAYSAAKKIPDATLKDVRKEFGKFSNINDLKKFRELVGEYLNDKEIEILSAPFIYKI